MIGVIVKSNEPFERALKRFTKSCEKNGIISDVKKRQRFEKPSEEKKRIETAARRKRLKEIADASTESVSRRSMTGGSLRVSRGFQPRNDPQRVKRHEQCTPYKDSR